MKTQRFLGIGIGLAAAIVFGTAAGSGSARPTETGLLFRELKNDASTVRYAVYVPREYDAHKKWPVVVFLNGLGECGTDGAKNLAVGLMPAVLLDEAHWQFIVVLPQKPDGGKQWEDYDDQVMSILSNTMKSYSTDRDRVYLTGLSQGGHGTWVLGARHANVWAAIAPVCGYGDPSEIAPKLKNMPIHAFHGESDHAVPVEQSRALVEAVNKAGGSAEITTYPGVDHNSWDKAYRDEKLYDWFLKHVRKSR